MTIEWKLCLIGMNIVCKQNIIDNFFVFILRWHMTGKCFDWFYEIHSLADM